MTVLARALAIDGRIAACSCLDTSAMEGWRRARQLLGITQLSSQKRVGDRPPAASVANSEVEKLQLDAEAADVEVRRAAEAAEIVESLHRDHGGSSGVVATRRRSLARSLERSAIFCKPAPIQQYVLGIEDRRNDLPVSPGIAGTLEFAFKRYKSFATALNMLRD